MLEVQPAKKQDSENSSMTQLNEAATDQPGTGQRTGGQASPSFMTQALRPTKQPARSPRDKQMSPKRARVGDEQDADDQEDTSSPEVGFLPDDVGGLQGPVETPVASADGAQAGVFSPVFHCMRTLRSSLEATQAPDATHTYEHPAEEDGQDEHHSQWVEQQQADVEHRDVTNTVLASPAQAFHPHHPQPDEHHQDEHHHHTMVPEAVEHELPADQTAEVDEELDYMEFDPLLFIKLLPPLEQVVPRHRPALLPRKTRTCKKKTLVLDLDETLVHSCLEPQAVADFTFPVHFNSQEHIIHVRQRPHLHTFMNRVAELFEVVVFTASQKIYAEKLLNILDPERRLIKHRIFRESCVMVDGNYLKDLSVLGRDLRNTLIIDNSPQAFGFQVDNGVPIESWYEDMDDTELLKLLPFLEQLVEVEDVRPAIRDKFRMREKIDSVVP